MGDKVTMDGVISNLRACLLSAKGGVSINCLNNDYRMLVGEGIPFRKLGFASLDEFLNTISGINIHKRGGEWIVEARPTGDTAHISKMVARQKSAPKKHSKKVIFNHRRPAPSFWKPAPMSEVLRRTSRSGKENSQYHQNGRSKTVTPPPLMALPIINPLINNERPRYMLPTPGTAQSSPSKQFQDKKANATALPQNQSGNKPKSTEQLGKTSKQQTMPMNGGYNGFEPVQVQVKSRSNLSDRLIVKPTVLSPLSPAHLVAGTEKGLPASAPSPPSNINQRNWLEDPAGKDPRELLKALAQVFNLSEPVYKLTPRTTKGKVTVYSQVKVGPQSYNSYPNEVETSEEAEKLAAGQALKDLLEKYDPLSCLAKTTDKNLIKERVTAIVDKHPNGVFMQQVPIYYKQEYRESLPENWLRIVEESSAVMLDKVANNSTILRRFAPHSEKVEEVTSPRMDKIQLNPIGPVAPGVLQLPEENFWIAFVTLVRSTVDVWVRLVGDEYSEEFDVMANEMEQHYTQMKHLMGTEAIEVGNYYAVSEDDSWHRVQCLEYNSVTGEAAVLFIDHGDDDYFHYSKLYALDKKFCILPAQAVRVCLAGLEEFADCESIVMILQEHLLGRILYAEIISRDIDEDGSFATVLLHDTNGPEDVNLNKLLSKKFMQLIGTPKLNLAGQVAEVFLSHADENGDVFVQVKSESMKYLVNMLNQLKDTGFNAEDVIKSSVTTIDTTKLYYALCYEDGNWYRCKIVDIRSDNRMKMILVDFGRTMIAERKNMISLEKLSDVLATYPHQALKVRLHNIPEPMFSDKMVTKLTELAPHKEPLLVKVIESASNGSPPIVELFKRMQPNNVLVSINNTLALEPELIRSSGDGNNNTRPRKRVERMTSRYGLHGEGDSLAMSLKPPQISDIGSYFDVHVTMAANPGNFTVQPFNDAISLEAMMVQLQEHCMTYDGPHPTADSVKEGKLYAAKHIDGHWYRVCISHIINNQMVTVYFCDFGDVSVLTLDMLQPLKRQFLELPYQAIKARLVGIQPVNIDWSVEDCLRFQELVVERNFVSLVVESGPDKLSLADTVLGLRLIDVSSEEDVYIDRVLVEEGRAIQCQSECQM